jgi:hypothetical protein
VRLPRLQPGERLSADLVNRMLDAIERLEGMTADASSGIELVRTAGGLALRTNSNIRMPVILKITSTDTTSTDGLYPAVIESCTNPDGNPPVWNDGAACYAVDANSALLLTLRYEGLYIGDHADGTPVFGVSETPARNAVLRLTGSVASNGLYPCDVETWTDGSPPVWGDSSASAWAFPPNGETLAIQRYPAVLVGTHSDGHLVFTVSAGRSSGAVVRVTGSKASNGMWPAAIQNFTDGSPPTMADGTEVWAFAPNAGPLSSAPPSEYYVAIYALTHSDNVPVYAVAGTVISFNSTTCVVTTA